jgi:hypothetical protein
VHPFPTEAIPQPGLGPSSGHHEGSQDTEEQQLQLQRQAEGATAGRDTGLHLYCHDEDLPGFADHSAFAVQCRDSPRQMVSWMVGCSTIRRLAPTDGELDSNICSGQLAHWEHRLHLRGVVSTVVRSGWYRRPIFCTGRKLYFQGC